MKITLRQRIKGQKITLYLDYYHKGSRKTETLDLYLTPDPPKGRLTPEEKKKNQDILRLATSICHRKQMDFQSGSFSLSDLTKQKALFLPYLEKIARDRSTSSGNQGSWKSVIKHFRGYAHGGITFENVSVQFIEGFKKYLNSTKKSDGNPLSQNSKAAYFNKLLAALKQAKFDGFIQTNPGERVSPIRQSESKREFLTLEELETLVNTECESDTLKTAFIFSCLTGLRFGDIWNLDWDNFQYSEDRGHFIRFRQGKTSAEETLPITNQAYDLLGTKPEYGGKVLSGLSYSAWNNNKLKMWFLRAGITRNLTFHSARHTHATMQLSLGTDIFTVSKLLGHKSVKTTQIYAKVMDQKKVEAVNKIHLKSLPRTDGEKQ
jgi:integrase